MAANLDIESAVAKIRADQTALFEQAVEMADTEEDKQYVRLQAALAPMVVEFARWDMGCHNSSEDAFMATQALGDTIASILWSFGENSALGTEPAVELVMGRVAEILTERISGNEMENSLQTTTAVANQPFGRA